MTDCGANYDPTAITLTFSGTTIGEHVHKLISVPQRIEAVARIANFWATQALMDGRYPCVVWDHQFSVFESGINRWDFAKKYFAKAALHFGGSPQQLLVVVSGTTTINFGNCYLEGYSVETPDNLLGYAAGIYGLKFLGTAIPTVVVTTP